MGGGGGRIRDSYANPGRSLGYVNMERRCLFLFFLIFLKINSTNEGKNCLLIRLSIQKDFLNTRSIQSSFLLTNQIFALQTSKSKFNFVEIASEQASAVWMKATSALELLNLWEKYLKLGENRRNIQKIYDSVRKELKDEITVLDRTLK